MNTKSLILAGILGTALASQAALITHIATDETGDAGAFTGAEWRTDSVAKPNDIDGDNVLGTDGWKWFGYDQVDGGGVNNGAYDQASLPSYISSIGSTPLAWDGDNGWADFDDPLNPGSDKQGTYAYNTPNTAAGDFDITITRNTADAFRLTLFGSAGDFLINSMITVSTTGSDPVDGSANDSYSVTTGQRWYMYFDIGAGTDDITVNVARISGDQRGLTGMAFDTAPIPEPSTLALLGAGGVMLMAGRRRKSRSANAA